ncbi:MAG: orotidine 5'-phosphate decarboxylase / HUMPS family protein [Candidatus Nanoarchaeia archaeon]
MLDKKTRYLQIAFNSDLSSVERILPHIPQDERIFIEAGTPFIKNEGMNGIKRISDIWSGIIVADLKTADGAVKEVFLASNAGATAATVLGSSPAETLNLFIEACKELKMYSMIDMIGIEEPLKVLLKLKAPPDVVILHKGRDEESTKGKIIGYKNINKIKSKYNVLISAAGGVDLREARSAIFNGANIVVANIVSEGESWTGINENEDIEDIAKKFLETIE